MEVALNRRYIYIYTYRKRDQRRGNQPFQINKVSVSVDGSHPGASQSCMVESRTKFGRRSNGEEAESKVEDLRLTLED